MDKSFENCPKECPLEENSKWLREKACEIMRKLEAEKAKLSLQLEMVLKAISEGTPCPSTVDLQNGFPDCKWRENCGECWKKSLETVGEDARSC